MSVEQVLREIHQLEVEIEAVTEPLRRRLSEAQQRLRHARADEITVELDFDEATAWLRSQRLMVLGGDVAAKGPFSTWMEDDETVVVEGYGSNGDDDGLIAWASFQRGEFKRATLLDEYLVIERPDGTYMAFETR